MKNLRAKFKYAICLMFLGLLGRVVAGSMPLPPMSPFLAGVGAASAETCSLTIHLHLSDSCSLTKTSKRPVQHVGDHQPRPWYGLIQFDSLSDSYFTIVPALLSSASDFIPSPDLATNLRPPAIA